MNDRSKILKIVAVLAAVVAITVVIYSFRREIRDFFGGIAEKIKIFLARKNFTDEEYEDFADL